MFFNNTRELLAKFSLASADYYGEIELKDRKVGFSIKRKYPKNIGYKPSYNGRGEVNNVAVIWVVYLHPTETTLKIDPNHVPVKVRISNVDLYVSQHWDYDFSDPESPTKESLEISHSSPKPSDLESNEEYFFNHSANRFFDIKGQELVGIEILNRIFIEHCNTTHPIKSIPFRAKLSAVETVADLISHPINFTKAILKGVFGRTLESDPYSSEYFKGYKKESLKKLSTDNLEIFGYKAPKGVIILFCLIIIICATIPFFNDNFEKSYIGKISDRESLAVAHMIFILWLLDFFLPPLFLKLMNLLIELRSKLMHLKIKV